MVVVVLVVVVVEVVVVVVEEVVVVVVVRGVGVGVDYVFWTLRVVYTATVGIKVD